MKKRTLSVGILTAMMLLSPIAGGFAEASTLANTPTQQLTQKIMWGKGELTKTQIGRITFLTDVKVYKIDAKGVMKFHMNAKKGSMWRVHDIVKIDNKNYYDLGGGVRVLQSKLSKYESAPTSLIQKQVKEHGVHISWVEYKGVNYPQVRRLASKDVEDKINKFIQRNAKWAADETPNTVGPKEFKVTENKNNRLTVVLTTSLMDTEIGYIINQKYTVVFDVTTGRIVEEKLDNF